jgi:hypothetical protein
MSVPPVRKLDEFNAYWAIRDYLDGRLAMEASLRIIQHTNIRGLNLAMLVYSMSGHNNQDGYYALNAAMQKDGFY